MAKDVINYALVMKLEGREKDKLLKTCFFFGTSNYILKVPVELRSFRF